MDMDSAVMETCCSDDKSETSAAQDAPSASAASTVSAASSVAGVASSTAHAASLTAGTASLTVNATSSTASSASTVSAASSAAGVASSTVSAASSAAGVASSTAGGASSTAGGASSTAGVASSTAGVASSTAGNASTAPATSSTVDSKKQPVCVLVLGMAGSGKTNVVNRLATHFATQRKMFQVVNLDPAVRNIPYIPYIDIRDTVNYKEVMKQYGLGPNGGIVTSLNLFSTMFDDVLKLVAKRADQTEYVIFDTPGQIEVFNWSASGPIIAGALASVYPTIILYVVDTVRSNNTQTFMANMLYACSILYKYKLPFIIAFNKIDITDCKFAFDWMRDFEAFQDVLAEESTFVSNLTRSLSLALEEFYCNIKACGVSAVTGEGMKELESLMEGAAVEYEEYRAEYDQLKAKKQQQDRLKAENQATKQSGGDFQSVREAIKVDTEMLIGPASDDSDSEEERLDEDDTEETREVESFKQFIGQQKLKHQQQKQQQQQ